MARLLKKKNSKAKIPKAKPVCEVCGASAVPGRALDDLLRTGARISA
jgi:hypothetical protein